MTGDQLRETFLRYFERQGHTRVRSSSLVPGDDPTLLFTNAGMVQFKSVFLGDERRDYRRATSSQKCVRAGGKHNDLENVGRTARHHTFFEMLGNFSFGDYFKADAIAFAWEFLTKRPRHRPPPARSRPSSPTTTRPSRCGSGWPGSATSASCAWARRTTSGPWATPGPAVPARRSTSTRAITCRAPRSPPGAPCLGPACECDRWLEIWNLVFMQFNRDASGAMTPLPRPSIDTGMGLERVAAVMQGKASNFDTDLLRPLIDRVGRARRQALRARRGGRRLHARHRRSRPGRHVPHRRRRHALQRVAGLRAAPDHAPGHAPRPPARAREPFLHRSVEWVVEPDGRGLSRARARAAAHRRTPCEARRSGSPRRSIAAMRRIEEYRRGPRRRDAAGPRWHASCSSSTTRYGFPRDLAEDALPGHGLAGDRRDRRRPGRGAMAAQRERARAGAAFGGDADAAQPGSTSALSAELPRPEFVGYDSLTHAGAASSPWWRRPRGPPVPEAGEGPRSRSFSTARRPTRSRAARSATRARWSAVRAAATSSTRTTAAAS